MTLLRESNFGSEQTRLEVVGNAIRNGDGFDIPIDTGVSSGSLWCHEDHYNALDLDDDNVITNGQLSRSGRGLTCVDVAPPESNYGLKPKKK